MSIITGQAEIHSERQASAVVHRQSWLFVVSVVLQAAFSTHYVVYAICFVPSFFLALIFFYRTQSRRALGFMLVVSTLAVLFQAYEVANGGEHPFWRLVGLVLTFFSLFCLATARRYLKSRPRGKEWL
jgi:hypothetical protein